MTKKQIPGFSDYFATKDGQIISTKSGLDRILRPGKATQVGYLLVVLCRDGKTFNRLVHRLVLLAFVGPCPEGMECCHNNGNPADNRLENLRWDTKSANQKDRILHGTTNRGSNSKQAKLTEEQVLEIYKSKDKQTELAALFGVTNKAIHHIKSGKNWSWLTGVTRKPNK